MNLIKQCRRHTHCRSLLGPVKPQPAHLIYQNTIQYTQSPCHIHTSLHRSAESTPAGMSAAEAEFVKSLQPEKQKIQNEFQAEVDKSAAALPDHTFALRAEGQGVTSPKLEQLADTIVNLSLYESKALQDIIAKKLGLPDNWGQQQMMMAPAAQAAPAQAAAPAAAATPKEPEKPAEAKTVFNIRLDAYDAKDKIKVIKEVRAATGLGLKESKELVEGTLPKVVKKDVKKEDADAIQKKLIEAGAKVTLE